MCSPETSSKDQRMRTSDETPLTRLLMYKHALFSLHGSFSTLGLAAQIGAPMGYLPSDTSMLYHCLLS